ncbi:MAG: hypothetical protein JW940_13040 [Polyangiaceae bacterium]|nr:hypothetical protein [Polyangiaceae bacterium]
MMKQRDSGISLLVASALTLAALGCEPGGVGDPCTPEDEYREGFSNYGLDEVNIESRSFQCETRLCLVNHFQGRVSCPYGQTQDQANNAPRCWVPGKVGEKKIEVAVAPQLEARQDEVAVYCSCRCAGPDPNAHYCDCPDGYSCTKLVDDLGLGRGQLAGSYCVRSGTAYDVQRKPPLTECNEATAPCQVNE